VPEKAPPNAPTGCRNQRPGSGLGGLTTFSIEVVTLIGRGPYGWALGTAGLHLLGWLALTGVGIALAPALFGRR
jgi:fluoride ion exporter CrcB/FEX